MKALTIRQPWASLIVLGAKSIETRSKPTSYRGELAIHAARTFGPRERHAAGCAVPLPFLQAAGLDPDDLPRSAVLGTVILWDCKPVEELYDFLHGRAGARERMVGDYGPGRWAWMLRDARPLPQPVPAVGALAFWEWKP
jgi:activating signal cointegrator 1